jgi:2-oxoglutarate ferredoxin oxidoreductase subunit alpha
VDDGYCRYRDTESGISPMTIPGMAGGQYTADGLEHNERGKPSSAAKDHVAQLSKRLRKLTSFDYGVHWADIQGHGELAILTWGSVHGVVREALSMTEDWQSRCRLIGIRLLAPARPAELAEALKGVRQILVVEQSHGGQFYDYLRASYDLPGDVRSLSQPGPLPISSAALDAHMTEWH